MNRDNVVFNMAMIGLFCLEEGLSISMCQALHKKLGVALKINDGKIVGVFFKEKEYFNK